MTYNIPKSKQIKLNALVEKIIYYADNKYLNDPHKIIYHADFKYIHEAFKILNYEINENLIKEEDIENILKSFI
jgi:hypothetical protein|tara:strand:- start:1161 stop:1382 length:222 start_codon:yes stop_codon:yes gene_type:complete